MASKKWLCCLGKRLTPPMNSSALRSASLLSLFKICTHGKMQLSNSEHPDSSLTR